METAPRNCRFLSLVVVERALKFLRKIILSESFFVSHHFVSEGTVKSMAGTLLSEPF